jgi:ectoine hydroxylase-related dioxygenase (phytanoyl-CoA dioxygenase family)
MTGEPGDVILTHPLLLHAAATNCAEMPRMVLSSIIRAEREPSVLV